MCTFDDIVAANSARDIPMFCTDWILDRDEDIVRMFTVIGKHNDDNMIHVEFGNGKRKNMPFDDFKDAVEAA